MSKQANFLSFLEFSVVHEEELELSSDNWRILYEVMEDYFDSIPEGISIPTREEAEVELYTRHPIWDLEDDSVLKGWMECYDWISSKKENL